MLVPVVMFVYNRPEHVKKMVEALAQNGLAKDTEVYIYSDAAKDIDSEEAVRLVRAYIDSLPEKNYFKDVYINKAESNRGLAKSILNGVDEVMNHYEKIIVLEDDLVASKDFLQFMNDALAYYETNQKIWSICGYTPPLTIPEDYKNQVYLAYRAGTWGWATWKDRWSKVDWQVLDYMSFKEDKKLREQLNRGGGDMAYMLDAQMAGLIDSWGIRWCYAQSKLEMLTVYPVVARIRNIGLDGTGTHSGINPKYDVVLNEDPKRCEFNDPGLDSRIVQSFRNFFTY